MRRLLPVMATVALGCAPATVQMARTNGKGAVQVGLEPGVINAVPGELTPAFLPTFNVAIRYGLSDRTDIGGRLGTSVYELQIKHMFTDPASGGVALSLAPSFTVLGGGIAGVRTLFVDARLPLLIGIPVGSSELTLGPMLRPAYVGVGLGGPAGAGAVLSGGAQVGFAGHLGRRVWLVPQLDFGVPLVGANAAGGDSAVAVGGTGTIYAAQLGILLGGPGPR